jgi:hypothetical protein
MGCIGESIKLDKFKVLKILSLVYTDWRDLKGDFVVFERAAFEGIKDIWSSLEIFPERLHLSYKQYCNRNRAY